MKVTLNVLKQVKGCKFSFPLWRNLNSFYSETKINTREIMEGEKQTNKKPKKKNTSKRIERIKEE